MTPSVLGDSSVTGLPCLELSQDLIPSDTVIEMFEFDLEAQVPSLEQRVHELEMRNQALAEKVQALESVVAGLLAQTQPESTQADHVVIEMPDFSIV